jgi:hypothetical protein
LKEVPPKERSAAKHLQMVHDECIRVARKLIDTGLPAEIGLLLADAQRYFPGSDDLLSNDPMRLELLAKQELAFDE